MKNLLYICLFSGLFNFPSSTDQGTLILKLENIEVKKGNIKVALFQNKQTFLRKGKSPYSKIIEVSKLGDTIIRFEKMPYGTYAIAVYHDLFRYVIVCFCLF